jgi:hypothetical protein
VKSGGISIFVAALLTAVLPHGLRAEERVNVARSGIDIAFAPIVANRAKTFISDGIALGFRYKSPVVIADGTPAPRDSVMEYHQASRPGSRAPHAWLSESRSTIDLFGHGFVLMRSGADTPDPSGLAAAAKQRGVPFEVVTNEDPAIAQIYEQPLVLVRPVGHIAWRAAAAAPDPLAIIDRVRGV